MAKEINSSPETGPTILAVDDDRATLRVIEAHLARVGFIVRTATSGEDALKVLSALTPAVLILDVMLPGISDYDLCHVVKREPRLKEVPVVFLTSRDTPKDFKTGHDLGAVIYISKPFKPEQLVHIVQMLAGAPA